MPKPLAKELLVAKDTRAALRTWVCEEYVQKIPGFEETSLTDTRIAKPTTPATIAAAAAKPRSTSRPLKSTDSKVHDGAIPADAVASGGSSSDEGKVKQKKDRSQSRKRGGLFGAFLGKKEEYEEKKESKKEEKAEEKAIKNEIKKEEKLEKEEVKAEKKVEKEQAKDGIAGGSAPLDAVAVGMLL